MINFLITFSIGGLFGLFISCALVAGREYKNERLNNVINELEEALKSHQYIKVCAHYGEYYVEIDEILDFIKKLKEGK